MTPIWIMARITFWEAARKRMLWMALAAGGAFVLLFSIAIHFQVQSFSDRHLTPFLRDQALGGMLMAGLYAVDLLAVVMAVLTSVDTLSGEIESGTIQALATKPVRRWELFIGKWLGFTAMLAAYILLIMGGITAVTFAISGVLLRHFAQGFALIWLETVVLLTVTLFFGASFSTLTNGVLTLGLHGLAFVGGWVEQAGALTNTPKAVAVGVVASLLMPSESLWRRAAFEMQSPLVTAANVTPFSGASVPSIAMIAYAGCYALVFFLLAIRRLETRDL